MELLLFLDLLGGIFGVSYSWFQIAEDTKGIYSLQSKLSFSDKHILILAVGTNCDQDLQSLLGYYLEMQGRRVFLPHYFHNTAEKLSISYWLKFSFQQNWIEII